LCMTIAKSLSGSICPFNFLLLLSTYSKFGIKIIRSCIFFISPHLEDTFV
jgi:hypothetical protein